MTDSGLARLFAQLAQPGSGRVERAMDTLADWAEACAVGVVTLGPMPRHWVSAAAPAVLLQDGSPIQPELHLGALMCVDDLQQSETLQRIAQAHPNVRAALIVPVLGFDGQAAGWLFVGRATVHPFDAGHQQALQAFAATLGMSVSRELAFEEQRQRYERLMEQAADSIFLLDHHLNIIDANRMCCELLGYSHEELTQLRLTDIMDSSELAQNPVPWLQQTGDMLLIERAMVHKNGTSVQVEANVALLDNGLIQGIARDIGGRKRHEDELRSHVRLLDAMQKVQARYISTAIPRVPFREALLQLLSLTASEHGFVASVTKRSDGQFDIVRSAAGTVEQIDEITAAAPPWVDQTSLQRVLSELDAGATCLREFSAVDGESDPRARIEYLVVPLRTRQGLAGLACVADSAQELNAETAVYLRPFLTACANIIHARRAAKAQQRAEAEAARLGHILEHASNEILVFEGDSLQFIEANEGARSNLRYELETLLGMTPMGILPHIGVDHFQSMLLLLREGRQEQVTFETMVKRQDGSVYPVEVSLQIAQPEGTEYFVVIMQDISIRKQAEERVSYLVHHDRLTGLPNRIGFIDRLDQVLTDAGRDGSYVAVLFVDLDRFQIINDTLGHEAGDTLLKLVAKRLEPCMRPGDTLARLGGDEFTIILPEVEPIEEVARFAQRLLDAFEEPFEVHNHEIFTNASVGITLFPIDSSDITGLLRNADTALAHAKRAGRNTYQFFTNEMNARAIEKLALETELRRALEREELVVHYQPQVNLGTGRITGVEALLRWNHPRLGLVSPSAFIPLAEETGLIITLGEWVLQTACDQVVLWHGMGFAHLRVAVNLSARQLVKQILPTLHETVRKSGIDPRCVELELTESLLMEDDPNSIQALHELQAFGVGFSIDDFGTGYSSLGYLKQLPIDTLKIDRSFVRDVIRDPDDAAIAKAIIAMAHGLGIRVIAEGVETRPQLEFLQQHRCDAFQGYFFSPPLPADELTRLLLDGRSLHDL